MQSEPPLQACHNSSGSVQRSLTRWTVHQPAIQPQACPGNSAYASPFLTTALAQPAKQPNVQPGPVCPKRNHRI
jgi:hypothetical protein